MSFYFWNRKACFIYSSTGLLCSYFLAIKIHVCYFCFVIFTGMCYILQKRLPIYFLVVVVTTGLNPLVNNTTVRHTKRCISVVNATHLERFCLKRTSVWQLQGENKRCLIWHRKCVTQVSDVFCVSQTHCLPDYTVYMFRLADRTRGMTNCVQIHPPAKCYIQRCHGQSFTLKSKNAHPVDD